MGSNSEHALFYDSVYRQNQGFYPPIQEVNAVLPLDKTEGLQPKTALEIGAGLGGNADHLRKCGFDVIVTEISTVAAGILRKRGFKVIEEDVCQTGIRDDYDMIVCSKVFQCMSEDETDRTIRDMQRHTKSGGSNIVVAYAEDQMLAGSQFAKKYYFPAGKLGEMYFGWAPVYYKEGHWEEGGRGLFAFVRGIFVKP